MQTEYQKQWWKNNPKKVKQYSINNRLKNIDIMKQLKINGCSICGYNKCHRALDFHHVNRNDKKFNVTVTSLNSIGLEKILIEMNKCILLCSNCHDEIEWGNLG